MSRYSDQNPLDRAPAWRQPQHQVAAYTEPPEFDYNPFNKEAQLMQRAVLMVRMKYGIDKGEILHRWSDRHDKEARAVYQSLMKGEHCPEGYRQRQPKYTPPEQRQLMPIRYGPSWL